MYKYLTKKLESTNGTHIVDLTMIAFEILNHSKSEIIEDFGYLEIKEICEVLEWDYEKAKSVINEAFEFEETIDEIMYKNGRTGYLAKIHKEIPNLVNGKTFMYSEGHCRVAYVYAHTIAELVDKAVEIGNEIDKEERKRALEKKEKENNTKVNENDTSQKH